jgi:hypothetical protein
MILNILFLLLSAKINECLTISLYISGFTFGVIFIDPTNMKKKPIKRDNAVSGSDLIIFLILFFSLKTDRSLN